MPQNKLYREEALNRISSPDQLNGYIRTSGSGVWFALGAILLVLVGIIVWGFTGSFEITLEATGGTHDGNSACFIHASERDLIQEGMQVRYLSRDKTRALGIITSISDQPMSYIDACNAYSVGLATRMGFTPNAELYKVNLLINTERKDEIATIRIVRDTVRPSSLLFGISSDQKDGAS